MEACFAAFDKDEDHAININEFTAICKALFRNDKGKPYKMDTQQISDLFMIFNVSGDGSMSKQEFVYCWNGWIKKIVRPQSAFIIVDVQNDFISGSLAIINCPAGQNGEDVVAPINRLIDTVPFDMHCYSLDWHPSDHISFVDTVHLRKLHTDSPLQDPSKANMYDTVVFEGDGKNLPYLKMEQTLWPRHCVQESWGAELHKDLKVHPSGRVIHKGVNPDIDSYSAFFDNAKLGKTNLEELIRKEGCTDAYVCGIATDVCVASTAFHALELGFRTILVEDCSRGIRDDNIKTTFERVRSEYGCVVKSNEVKAMVQGRDRRPELGYKLALECRRNINYPMKNKNSKYNNMQVNPDGSLATNQTNESNHNTAKPSTVQAK